MSHDAGGHHDFASRPSVGSRDFVNNRARDASKWRPRHVRRCGKDAGLFRIRRNQAGARPRGETGVTLAPGRL